MLASLVAGLATALLSSAQAVEPPPEVPRGPALSVGTGPRPLDDLTLGLTGLGARVLLAGGGRAVPWFGFAATSGSAMVWSEGDYEDRSGAGGTLFALSGGIRLDQADRAEADLVPYGIVGALATYGWVRGGEPDGWDRTGGFGGGGLLGIGLDAFLTRHLSVGAELGAMGLLWSGDSAWDGEAYSQHRLTGLSSYTSIQATVWR